MRNQEIDSRDQGSSTAMRFAKRRGLSRNTLQVPGMSQLSRRIRQRFEVDGGVSLGEGAIGRSRPRLRMSAREYAGVAADGGEDVSRQDRESAPWSDRQNACEGSLSATETNQIRVLCINESPLLIEGIRALVEAQPDMRLVAWAANVEAGLRQYVEHQPDVTLMDFGFAEVNGVDAIGAVRNKFPDARLVILARNAGDVLASRALKAGALGYIPDKTLCRDLLDAIRMVHRGQKYIAPEVADALAHHAADDPLTPREIEILQQLAAGSANKMIADRLGISEGTVKTHMRNILSKLPASDRAHAVVIGIRRGFIEL